MLGIDDPLIWLAYVACLLVTLLSLAYGLLRRNRAPDTVTREDRVWAKVEKKVENEI
jgi:hypothetical protein